MKTICCNNFSFHYETDKNMGLNIRIIKLSESFIERGYPGDNVYRYLITEGYVELNEEIKKYLLNFVLFVELN